MPGPHVGSGVEIIDLICFLAGCSKGQLNQALSVLYLRFLLSVYCVVLFTTSTLIVLYNFVLILRPVNAEEVLNWCRSGQRCIIIQKRRTNIAVARNSLTFL